MQTNNQTLDEEVVEAFLKDSARIAGEAVQARMRRLSSGVESAPNSMWKKGLKRLLSGPVTGNDLDEAMGMLIAWRQDIDNKP